jgi:deoxyribose-phosphate aldolase
MQLKLAEFKRRLEYSLCQQFSSAADVRDFCDSAIKTGVGVICVNPINVSVAADGRIVKTIIETWVLSDKEKECACRIAERAGADQLGVSRGDKLAQEFNERFGGSVNLQKKKGYSSL